jgi:hypothetical protein
MPLKYHLVSLFLCGIALAAAVPAQLGIVPGGDMGAFVVHVETDSDNYSLGKPVAVRISGTNRGSTPLIIGWPNSCVYDFSVIDLAGNEVYRLSKNAVCAQVVTEVRIQSGETRGYDGIWNQVDNAGMSVRPGEYHLVAWLVGHQSENVVTFRLQSGPAETSTTAQTVSESPSTAIPGFRLEAILVGLALATFILALNRKAYLRKDYGRVVRRGNHS